MANYPSPLLPFCAMDQVKLVSFLSLIALPIAILGMKHKNHNFRGIGLQAKYRLIDHSLGAYQP
jgi:hypothetical protein